MRLILAKCVLISVVCFSGCSSPEVTACKKECKDAAYVNGGQSRCENHCRETNGKCASFDGSGGPFLGCVLFGMTNQHHYCKH